MSSPGPSTPRQLPANHFLSLPRPTFLTSAPATAPDVSTLAGADYDVDVRTGFMPPSPPVTRLPEEFAQWELTLGATLAAELQVGDKKTTTEKDWERAERWRATVRNLPTLSIASLRSSILLLRRAHQVLASIMHFYVHSAPPPPPGESVHIPAPIAVPLIGVSHELGVTPVLTYADTVLWNWTLLDPSRPVAVDNVSCGSLFSGTPSEMHFYTVSAQIELRGVEALDIMRSSLDEAFVGDALAVRRISAYLDRLAIVVDDVTRLMLTMFDGCVPAVFFNDVRPWFRGSAGSGRRWVYEGVPEEEAERAADLSGPSAGQSTLVHALDVFLGVDHTTHGPSASTPQTSLRAAPTFLEQMEKYMPGPHQAFIHNLASSAHAIRPLVLGQPQQSTLHTSYDAAVMALKRFRDAHIRIVTVYIVSQRAHAERAAREARGEVVVRKVGEKADIRGTGGTQLVPFLKETRAATLRTVVGKDA
ncbi:Indoleamine 2,3-dioxygenase [Calocera viscosa TUFC12733]|uniref:Indoleamine 2,3-dioxygenase n=1 Tax=Calocera viscosa (strain TUFC12733) TaxID=1330018 RepID=A0A167QYC7_CALVF|nr:Indoleamine 2,3-dioxygenase [Calocera viscosa TUFC12733]